jgi:hypothetical protein
MRGSKLITSASHDEDSNGLRNAGHEIRNNTASHPRRPHCKFNLFCITAVLSLLQFFCLQKRNKLPFLFRGSTAQLNLPCRNFVDHKSRLADSSVNPGCSGENPATNRFSYGAANAINYSRAKYKKCED